MNLKKRLAIAASAGLLLSGAAAGTVAAVTSGHYNTPTTYTMIFGSSGNIPAPAGGVGTVGPILPGQCALYGVGDYIPSTPCPPLLSKPYELTETPIASSSGVFTYLTVTTTNAAPAGGGNQINFSIRLCEAGANFCNVPPGGITIARCSPAPGSKTCSWIGKVPFNQWQPHLFKSDPAIHDEGLIDLVASRGCGTSCPNGTYDPGHVSWSVAYIK
jgi:hypothetical protein